MLWDFKPKVELRPAPAAARLVTPEKTTIVPTAPDQFESPEIREVYAVWNARRGEKPMPARADVLPRPLGKLLRNVSLVRVIAETNDYEMRIVGDAHAEAYGMNAQGLRVSQLMPTAPEMGTMLKDSYDLVRQFRMPIGFRGILGRDVTRARFDWFETLYLPLGSGGVVDHVLNASVYRPRDGKWPH